MTIRCDNGRQIRIMDGYPPGTRPDPITEGPYAVVSQGNGPAIKIAATREPGPVSAEIIAHLLDEMEEYYGAFDHYPLYQFSAGISTTSVRTTRARSTSSGSSRHIDEFTSRHSTKVVWVPLADSNSSRPDRSHPALPSTSTWTRTARPTSRCRCSCRPKP